MKNQGLYKLFIEELKDMYNAEHQILKALPKVISHASLPELKEALTKHVKETEHQIKRIEKIFNIIDVAPEQVTCEGIKGILEEGDELIKDNAKSPTLDAAIISACQKVEHYEIASYGTLRSFAKQLEFDSDVVDLIQDSLDEEGAADKKLTKLAEGSFFTSGVNKEAAETGTSKYRK